MPSSFTPFVATLPFDKQRTCLPSPKQFGENLAKNLILMILGSSSSENETAVVCQTIPTVADFCLFEEGFLNLSRGPPIEQAKLRFLQVSNGLSTG